MPWVDNDSLTLQDTNISTSTVFTFPRSHAGDVHLHAIKPAHWEEYFPIPRYIFTLAGLYMTFVGIVGAIGNFVVIWVFLSAKELRTAANLFIVNLAVSDFLVSVTGFPMAASSAFAGSWIFGKTGCDSYGVLVGISSLTSINTMAVIAFDRYLAIASPSKAAHYITHKSACCCCLFIWVYCSIWAFLPIIGWNQYVLEGLPVSCTFDYLAQDVLSKAFVVSLALVNFFVPAIVMAVCYAAVFVIVVRHQKEVREMRGHNRANATSSTPNRVEVKVAKISAIILLIFIMSWSSYAIIALLSVFDLVTLISPYVASLPGLFAKASSVYNPFVYAISHPRFQKRCRSWFRRLCSCPLKRRPNNRMELSSEHDNDPNLNGLIHVELDIYDTIPINATTLNTVTKRETEHQPNGQKEVIELGVCRKTGTTKTHGGDNVYEDSIEPKKRHNTLPSRNESKHNGTDRTVTNESEVQKRSLIQKHTRYVCRSNSEANL